jgi:hypothetical protein
MGGRDETQDATKRQIGRIDEGDMAILTLICQFRNLFQAPNVIADASFHRRRDAQRFIDASEIVVYYLRVPMYGKMLNS